MPATKRITLGKIIIWGIFIFPCLVVFIIGGFLAYLLFWQEFRIKQSSEVYEGADKIGEYRSQFGAGHAVKDSYYWTEDSIEAVKRYYEGLFPLFRYATPENQWLITSYTVGDSKNGFEPNDQAGMFTSFCYDNRKFSVRKNCVTVILVDLEKEDILELPVIADCGVRCREDSSRYRFVNSIPTKGTLIIYTYWIIDF